MCTHNIAFSICIRKHPELSKSAAVGFFFKGLKNEFETVVVNEPSVFQQLKFYCNINNSQVRNFRALVLFCNFECLSVGWS